MKQIKDMSLGELAAHICTHLAEKGIKCVLTGGACVSIYTKNRYQSYDLDFIENGSFTRKELAKALSEIGFSEENRYFKHPDTEYFIEFPAGPLAVGKAPVKEPDVMEYETGRLLLLSPSDCIKDRLAAYYHWKDKQCLEQAVMISESQPIDIDEIKMWSEQEGKLLEFNMIKDKLVDKNRHL